MTKLDASPCHSSYATAAVALYQAGVELAPVVNGGLAYMADIASSLAMAMLTGTQGGFA